MTALGLDVGDRRIGVAVGDPTGLLARPLSVLVRRSNVLDAERIARIAAEQRADTIVVGLPLNGDGSVGPQAQKTLAFVRFLRRTLAHEIQTWDERDSTVDAQRELIAQGVRRAKRRELLDAAAAAVLLDGWLSARREAHFRHAPDEPGDSSPVAE